MKHIHKQAGFSLVELVITLVLFSLMAGTLQLSQTRRLAQQVEHNELEQVAENFYRLANAALHYATQKDEWPNELLMCANAYQTLDDESLLRGASAHSPFLREDHRPAPYRISCTTQHLLIDVDTGSTEKAQGLAVRIPGGAVVEDTQVQVSYPKPIGQNGGPFMRLDGSALPEDTWNMNDQYVFGARDVITETGQTLLNSVQFATTATSGETIAKPTCPDGMRPLIFTAVNRISAPSRRAIHGIHLPVDEYPNEWRVRAVVTGSSGEENVDSTTAKITAFVKCSY